MGILCVHSSRMKAGAPSSFSMETGVFCSLFGTTSAGCKFLDILPALFNSISTAKKAADFIKIAYNVNKALPDGLVDTEQFCMTEPPQLTDDDIVTWGDVFSAFNGIYPDALVEKMSKVFAYKKWFEYCECGTAAPDPTPTPPPGFPPRPPTPEPVGLCGNNYQAVAAYYQGLYDDRIAASEAWLSVNPGTYEYQGEIVSDPDVIASLGVGCNPFCEAIAPDENTGCLCRYTINLVANGGWRETPDPNNNGKRFQIFDRLPIGLKYDPICPEEPPPEGPLPNPDDEADNGEQFCTYFPELCIQCPPPPPGCTVVPIDVPLLTECGTPAGTITVYLNSCGDTPPPPDCVGAIAAVDAQFGPIAATYVCPDFANFVNDTQADLDNLKLQYPGCGVDMEVQRDATFSNNCIPGGG